MTFKNDKEFQDRWKDTVKTTHIQYYYVSRVIDFIEDAMEIVIQAFKLFSEVMCTIFEDLSEALVELFKPINESLRESIDMDDMEKNFRNIPKISYPHIYPQCVNNFKVNTHGFPQDISKCVRSRC